MTKVRAISHQAIVTYWQYPDSSSTSDSEAQKLGLHRCLTAYTGHIDPNTVNDFELVIQQSLELVLGKICTFEYEAFLRADRWLHQGDHERSISGFTEVQDLSDDVQSVIKWLGWDNWSDCPDQCSGDVR